MNQNQYKTDDIIESIQNAALSLSAGMSLTAVYKHSQADIENEMKDIDIDGYILSVPIQKHALQNKSIERFLVFSSFRSVFSTMYEGLKNNQEFKNHIKSKISENYDDFYVLINLLRNIYSHEFTSASYGSVVIKTKDYEDMLKYRRKEQLSNILSLNIAYIDFLPNDAEFPSDYKITFSLDLQKIQNGIKLVEVMPIYQQLMLSELCHNLCNVIEA